jgi:2-C-methyl-D-erythritol 4-phosphate cytidylyltransferase
MRIAIIAAAGSGTRLQEKTIIKKQLYPLGDGKEMFLHSLVPFLNKDDFNWIYLTVPEEDFFAIQNILKRENIQDRVGIINGGPTREESVFNALNAIRKEYLGWQDLDIEVYIHDGDRPFLSPALLQAEKEALKDHQSAIPYIKVSDSLYNIKEGSYARREEYGLIQTPQAFKYRMLLKAFQSQESRLSSFTDEGSLVKAYGQDLYLIPGDKENIKISTPDDLERALQKAGQHV